MFWSTVSLSPWRSSRLVLPPVLTWLICSSVPYLVAEVAVSPPPMMGMAPARVAPTTASISALVPVAKASNSNTPAGPFHTAGAVRIYIRILEITAK